MAGRFSFGKTTQVKKIGTCASEQHFFFSLEHCSFACAGTAGHSRKKVAPVVLCAAICKLWAELHCAGIDSHLPRIITP